jgi:hypothetical protein
VGIVAVLIVATITVAVVLARRPGVGPAAPRLSPDLASTLLTRAGFPTTRHNVLAVRERLGAMFLEDVRPDVAPERWADVLAACEAGRTDKARWPQHVLDEIATADAPAATRAARRCQARLLAGVGTGRGFLGGSLFEPLPRTASPPPLATA